MGRALRGGQPGTVDILMRLEPLSIPGAYRIVPAPVRDERGSFTRWYDVEVFRAHRLELPDVQGGVSYNALRGTLRGLHFIPEAEGEAKLVRCTRGRIFDVVVDLRPASSAFGRWISAELSPQTAEALYIPRGCAHGFVSLEDESDVVYQFSMPFRQGVERGIRWDDPDIGIEWPLEPVVISERDRTLPLLRMERAL